MLWQLFSEVTSTALPDTSQLSDAIREVFFIEYNLPDIKVIKRSCG